MPQNCDCSWDNSIPNHFGGTGSLFSHNESTQISPKHGDFSKRKYDLGNKPCELGTNNEDFNNRIDKKWKQTTILSGPSGFFYTAIETRKLNMAISSKNMIPKLINLGFHSFFKGVQLRKKMGVSYRFLEICWLWVMPLGIEHVSWTNPSKSEVSSWEIHRGLWAYSWEIHRTKTKRFIFPFWLSK